MRRARPSAVLPNSRIAPLPASFIFPRRPRLKSAILYAAGRGASLRRGQLENWFKRGAAVASHTRRFRIRTVAVEFAGGCALCSRRSGAFDSPYTAILSLRSKSAAHKDRRSRAVLCYSNAGISYPLRPKRSALAAEKRKEKFSFVFCERKKKSTKKIYKNFKKPIDKGKGMVYNEININVNVIYYAENGGKNVKTVRLR